MREEPVDFQFSYLPWMPFVVEEDETPDPIEVSLFCPVRKMVEPQHFSALVQQSEGWIGPESLQTPARPADGRQRVSAVPMGWGLAARGVCASFEERLS